MEPVLLDIRTGMPCIVEPQGVGERFKSTFVGWEAGRYCVVKPPAGASLLEQLYAEKPCIVRYLDCQGVLCGFRTMVQTMISRPYRLLFLDYPEALETLSVRRDNRVDCFLPAVITSGEVSLPGHIVNLSAGGFRFSRREELGDKGLKSLENAVVQCRFSIVDDPVREFTLEGEIKSVAFVEGKVVCKGEFINVDNAVHHALDRFVSEVSEHINLHCDMGGNVI